MLTANYNEVNAEPGWQSVSLRISSSPIQCPDSNVSRDSTDFYGILRVRQGYYTMPDDEIVYRNEGGLWAEDEQSENTRGPPVGTFNYVRISGVPPNQEFEIRGTLVADPFCDSEVPTGYTVHGPCARDTNARFETTNGIRADFNVYGSDLSLPYCHICPENNAFSWAVYDSSEGCVFNPGLAAAMNASKSKDLTGSGANPADVHSSIGPVERDERPPNPQPQGDDEQQGKPSDTQPTDDVQHINSGDTPQTDGAQEIKPGDETSQIPQTDGNEKPG